MFWPFCATYRGVHAALFGVLIRTPRETRMAGALGVLPVREDGALRPFAEKPSSAAPTLTSKRNRTSSRGAGWRLRQAEGYQGALPWQLQPLQTTLVWTSASLPKHLAEGPPADLGVPLSLWIRLVSLCSPLPHILRAGMAWGSRGAGSPQSPEWSLIGQG